MPGFDGTGPFGNGRPGRGLGPCGRVARHFGNRLGRGGGNGGGRRWRCCWDYSPRSLEAAEQGIYPYNKASLEAQKTDLEERLKWIDSQLKQEQD